MASVDQLAAEAEEKSRECSDESEDSFLGLAASACLNGGIG